jgi:hypothetical protein
LLSKGSDESNSIKGFSEVSVLFSRYLLHYSTTFSLSIIGVVLKIPEKEQVKRNCDDHPGREVDSKTDLESTVSNRIENPVDVPEESSISASNVFSKVFEKLASRSNVEIKVYRSIHNFA